MQKLILLLILSTTCFCNSYYRTAENSQNPKDWICNGHDVLGTTAQSQGNKLNKNNAASLAPTWNALGSGVTGAPVVKNGIAYVARFDGTLDAYTVNTGMRLWSSGFLNGQIEGAPAIGEYVYISGRDTPVSPNDEGFTVVAAFD